MAIRIKTPKEIEGIRKSARLAAQCLKHLEQFATAGNTTQYINDKALEFMDAHGAKSATLGYHGFKGAICTSPNEVICHGVPGPYILRDGDILNIDVTTILDGYYGDTCKMYQIGRVGQEAEDLMKVTRECLRLGMAQCYPGNRFGNIGHAISEHAHSLGYSVVYEFCGHGVGLKFHEEPEISHIAPANSGKRMRPGMIFTIEPMINQGKARAKIDPVDGWTARTIDGKLSAQYEHTILITETGFEALTDVYGDF